MRLDQYLVTHGFSRSRDVAKRAIENGAVLINGAKARKASQKITPPVEIQYQSPEDAYVSRGALKLVGALEAFNLTVEGRHAIDIGSSTGGFSQVLLERRVGSVLAVDVGTGQLAECLRKDPRMTVREQTDARRLSRGDVPTDFDLIVCDVSFISIMKALAAVMSMAPRGAELVCLVKPQFELGRDHIGRGGLVSMALDDQRKWVSSVIFDWLNGLGWEVRDLIDSPITGGDGNHEFLLWAEKGHHDE